MSLWIWVQIWSPSSGSLDCRGQINTRFLSTILTRCMEFHHTWSNRTMYPLSTRTEPSLRPVWCLPNHSLPKSKRLRRRVSWDEFLSLRLRYHISSHINRTHQSILSLPLRLSSLIHNHFNISTIYLYHLLVYNLDYHLWGSQFLILVNPTLFKIVTHHNHNHVIVC